MKRLLLAIAAALLGLAASASAQTWSTITPTYGGGYRFNTYGPNGNSWGTTTPTYGGGYRFNSYGPNAAPGVRPLQHTGGIQDFAFRILG